MIDDLRDYRGIYNVYSAFKSDQDYYCLTFSVAGPYFFAPDRHILKEDVHLGQIKINLYDENGYRIDANEILALKNRENFIEIYRFVDKYINLTNRLMMDDELDFVFSDVLDDLDYISAKYPTRVAKKDIIISNTDFEKLLEKGDSEGKHFGFLPITGAMAGHVIKTYKYNEENKNRDK